MSRILTSVGSLVRRRAAARTANRVLHAPRQASAWVGLEPLENRVLLSVSFSDATLGGTLAVVGENVVGTVTHNDTGTITGGTYTEVTGTASTITGNTFNVTNTGALTSSVVGTNNFSFSGTGAVNSSGDVALQYSADLGSALNSDESLQIVPGSGFTDANLAGTWQVVGAGARGFVTLDNAGHVTAGSVVSHDSSSAQTITGGSYSISGTGAVTLGLTFKTGPTTTSSLSFSGAMNASGNLVALQDSTFGQNNSTDTGQLDLVDNLGTTYNNGILAGTWQFASTDDAGTITFDGKGKIVGGSLGGAGSSGTAIPRGSYSVSASGEVTLTITVTQAGGVVKTTVLKGEIDNTKDVVSLDLSDISEKAIFAAMVHSQDSKPDIGSISTNGPVPKGTPLLITASNVSVESPLVIKTVIFYYGTSSTFSPSDKALGSGTTTDGGATWSINAPTNAFAITTDDVFAVAVDNIGRTSDPIGTTVTISDPIPTISDLVGVPKHPSAESFFTLQATGVDDLLDPVQSVTFYWSPSGADSTTGAIQLGISPHKGDWAITTTLPASNATTPFPTSGSATFLAVAEDGNGTLSAREVLTETVSTPPSIGSLTSSSNPILRGGNVVLTAANVADTDTNTSAALPISRVAFYVDTVGDGLYHPLQDKLLGFGTALTNGTDWALTYHVPAKTAVGPITILAFAINKQGAVSLAASDSATIESRTPVIGKLTVNPTGINPGESYTLTAQGIRDPDGTAVTGVTFYSDPNDTGSVTGNGVMVLGTINNPGGSAALKLTAPSDLTVGQPIFFLAQATNAASQISNVVGAGPAIAPTIGSVITSSSSIERTQIVTITAQDVADTDEAVKQVAIYAGPVGATSFEKSADKLLGMATQTGPSTGNYALNYKVPANAVLGTYPLFAVATNSAGQLSAAATTNLTIIDHPPVIGSLGLVSKHVAAGNTLSVRTVDAADVDGKITSVTLYWDPTGAGTLTNAIPLQTVRAPANLSFITVTLPSSTASTNPFPTSGTATFIAQATDNDGGVGNLAVLTVPVVAPPVITTLTVSPTPVEQTSPAVLTLSGVTTFGSTTVSKVQFYAAKGSVTTLDTSFDTFLGLGVLNSGTGDWVLDVNGLSRVKTGDYTILAVVEDSNGVFSNVLTQDITIA